MLVVVLLPLLLPKNMELRQRQTKHVGQPLQSKRVVSPKKPPQVRRRDLKLSAAELAGLHASQTETETHLEQLAGTSFALDLTPLAGCSTQMLKLSNEFK